MKSSHHRVNNAKAVISLLVLAIAFVIFYKFVTNQGNLFEDPEALRNYVMFAIVGCGFLIGLLYLAGQTTHKESPKAKAKSVKAKSSKKKKK